MLWGQLQEGVPELMAGAAKALEAVKAIEAVKKRTKSLLEMDGFKTFYAFVLGSFKIQRTDD